MKRLQSSLLVLGGLGAGLILAEALYGWFPSLLPHSLQMVRAMDEDRAGAYAPDPVLHHVFKPDYRREVRWWRFNRTWRTAPLPGSRGKAGYRAEDAGEAGEAYGVALGDSYTSGWLVSSSETWPGSLARLTGRRFVNLGVDGYGTWQEYELYRRYGRLFHPRLVVLFMNTTDPMDDFVYQDWKRKKGEIYRPGYFWRSVQRAIEPYIPFRLTARALEYWDLLRPTFYLKDHLAEEMEHQWYLRGLPLTRRYVLKLAREVALERAVLVVVLMDRGVTKPFIPLFQKTGIRFVDFSVLWRVHRKSYVVPLDGHLNEKGHAAIAGLIFTYLSQNHLLETEK